jgi:sodium-dependent dicarboxylate transporter 2/3/5
MSSKRIGFILGLAFFGAILTLPPLASFQAAAETLRLESHSALSTGGIAVSMQRVLAVLLLMVVWWLTEAVSLPATALLPAILFPLLKISGVQGNLTAKAVLTNYAHPVIFLFLGGFLIAGAMQKWKLDRRFTLWLLTRGNLANDPRTILLGMMLTTAFASMWISNTATAAMMLPLGLGVLSLMNIEPGTPGYGTGMMLGIAWSASIGGVGTIIGSPPNGIALGVLDTALGSNPAYVRISFLDWMKFGVPYVLLYLPVAWLLLLKLHPPRGARLEGGKAELMKQQKALGAITRGELGTIGVFSLAVLLWVTNPFWDSILPSAIANQLSWLDEYSIGLLCGGLLFFVPADFRNGQFLLTWKDTRFVDWGTLILFGGGIALSDAMFKTGLAAWIARSFVALLGTPSTMVMVIAVLLLVIGLTEVTSNTAVTSMIVPIIVSIAIRTGENPVALAVAAAVAASMAFMLPVSTPPNALVYSTGHIQLRDMIKGGLILDLIGWVFTVVIIVVVADWMFGVLRF